MKKEIKHFIWFCLGLTFFVAFLHFLFLQPKMLLLGIFNNRAKQIVFAIFQMLFLVPN
jgi:hypothetical protein